MAAWKALVALPAFPVDVRESALVIIDMTKQQASAQHGICKRLIDDGYGDDLKYYLDRIDNVVVPAIARLADCFREYGASVTYTRCASMRGDGSDQTARHRAVGLVTSIDSEDAEFLPELTPVHGDIVLNKTGSSVFNSTNYAHLLRNMGVKTLVATGIFTNSCVEGALRDAGDLDFQALMAEDACAAMSPAGHTNAIQYLDRNFCHVKSTDEIVDMLRESASAREAEGVQ
jgi:ureidoacrylate peracid hydrolase